MENLLRTARRTSLNSVLAAVLAAGAIAGCRPAPTPAEDGITEAEVAAFMRDYATDLRARNVEGVLARYDSAGVYLLGNGNKAFVPRDSLIAGYRTGWKGPAFFEWSNLSYEPAGPRSMVVAGQFRWVDLGSTDTLRFSYTSLVRKTSAGLRIRVEDESSAPPAPR